MKDSKSFFFRCLWFSFFVSSQAFGFGGDDIGNGGGLAEKTIVLAYENLPVYAKLCLEMSTCRLDPNERKVLSAIVQTVLAQKGSGDSPILFESERRNPGFFVIDGDMKIAKTGSKPGSKIYINTDLLYSTNPAQQVEPIGLAQSVAVLVHEFGHHVSQMSHQELDLLGVKVSLILQSRIQATPALPWASSVSAVVIQSPQWESFPQVFLVVGTDIYDLSQIFFDTVSCPKISFSIPIIPLPDIQLGQTKPVGAILHNIHWSKVNMDDTGSFRVVGNLTHLCDNGQSRQLVNSYKLTIDFTTLNQNGEITLKDHAVRMTQINEPWYRLLQLGL